MIRATEDAGSLLRDIWGGDEKGHLRYLYG